MNKLQKIKDWISKEQEGLMDAQGNFEYPEHEGAYHILCNLDAYIDFLQEEPVSEELEDASKKYSSCIYLEEVLSDDDKEVLKARLMNTFKAGAKWQKANLWKLADGDLPEIDREVIALLNNGKVVYAHRPNPDGWDGKNILTGEVRHHDVQTHGKGRWNIPDVKFWLDCELPKIEE